MPESFEELRLIRRGETYALERWEGDTLSAMSLSEGNLLSLQPLIQKECARIAETLSTPGLKERGVEPIVSVAVHKWTTAIEIHQSKLLLTLTDKDGNNYSFSFQPGEAAGALGKRLIERAQELASATPPTKQ